jgi:hypothetical protein
MFSGVVIALGIVDEFQQSEIVSQQPKSTNETPSSKLSTIKMKMMFSHAFHTHQK